MPAPQAELLCPPLLPRSADGESAPGAAAAAAERGVGMLHELLARLDTEVPPLCASACGCC